MSLTFNERTCIVNSSLDFYPITSLLWPLKAPDGTRGAPEVFWGIKVSSDETPHMFAFENGAKAVRLESAAVAVTVTEPVFCLR